MAGEESSASRLLQFGTRSFRSASRCEYERQSRRQPRPQSQAVATGSSVTKLRGVRRVVVTGLGALTPVGHDAPSTWRAAVAGERAIDFIRSSDASDYPARIAAEVKDFDPSSVATPKQVRKLDRHV